MSKYEMIKYLMDRYNVTYVTAEDALRGNDWVLMMASGDLRDEMNATA